jgi:DNA-binding MurR/RpiR family transcriptional regulator
LTLKAVLRAILERLDRLSRQQRRVADAVLQRPELIAFHSVRDVAERIGMNNATIVRFAQALDYSGYPEISGGAPRVLAAHRRDPAPPKRRPPCVRRATASRSPAASSGRTSRSLKRSSKALPSERIFAEVVTSSGDAIIELLVAHIAGERSADTMFERQTMYDTYLDEWLLASFETDAPSK